MNVKLRRAVLLIAILATGPTQAALPELLTFKNAIEKFRTHGVDLLLAQAQIDSARADARSAGLVPNPNVSVLLGSTVHYVPPAGCTADCSQFLVTAALSDQNALFDTVWGKRSLRKEVAVALVKAAEFSRSDAERALMSQFKQQYVRTLLAKALTEFARDVVTTATQTSDLIAARYRSGAVSEAEAAKAETAKLEAEQDYDLAQQSENIEKAALGFLLNARAGDTEFVLEDKLDPMRVLDTRKQALAPFVHDALEYRPDLKVVDALIARAERSQTLARRSIVPDMALLLNYTQQGQGEFATQPPTLSGGLSLTLPLFYQAQGERSRALVEARVQRLNHVRLEAQILSEVQTAYVALRGAQRRSERMEGRLLDRAMRTQELIALQYQKGAASLLELVDARRTYIANRVEYLQGLADYWIAEIKLEQAVGRSYGTTP